MMAWNFSVPNFYSYANASTENKQLTLASQKRLGDSVNSVHLGRICCIWPLPHVVTGLQHFLLKTVHTSTRLSVVHSYSQQLLPNNDILTFGKVRASWAKVGKDTGAYETNTSRGRLDISAGNGVGNSWSWVEINLRLQNQLSCV